MEKQDSGPRRIALIGLPATGKTSVGALLASLEGLPFVDLDEAIAAGAGKPVAAIFEAEGEPGFRARERAALAAVAAGGPVVLATGGGCVESPENRALLRERFSVVWLKADLASLAARSVGGSRPLLAGDAEAMIRVLYERRRPWYAECAALDIHTDGMRPSMIAEAIHDALG
ncbi:MAG: shikimate kinase [Spirochaetes bacterium]|nr:shikimate kinase [Spirochaetota bacterium]MBU1082383.1 shikimate kinase [Spirochaetota bacterium]